MRVAPDPDRFAWRDDFFRKRFEEDFRTLRIVDAVVGVGAELGFHHAGFPAPEIRDASGPYFLGFDGRQQPDGVERVLRESGVTESREFLDKVDPLDETLHAMHAGASQVENTPTVRDQTDANVSAAFSCKAAQFHGGGT